MVVAALLATGCQQSPSSETSVASSNSEVTSVSESLLPVVSSENSIVSSSSSSVEYYAWEADVVQVLVEALIPDTSIAIPAFNYATFIEYDYEFIYEDECFGIFCKTEDLNAENIYKQTLIDAFYMVRVASVLSHPVVPTGTEKTCEYLNIDKDNINLRQLLDYQITIT